MRSWILRAWAGEEGGPKLKWGVHEDSVLGSGCGPGAEGQSHGGGRWSLSRVTSSGKWTWGRGHPGGGANMESEGVPGAVEVEARVSDDPMGAR